MVVGQEPLQLPTHASLPVVTPVPPKRSSEMAGKVRARLSMLRSKFVFVASRAGLAFTAPAA